jgi:hypothetical protein
MKRYFKAAAFGLLLVCIVALAVYPYLQRRGGKSASMTDKHYSTDLNELHTRFNQDKGKVRILLLLSPT